MRAVIGGAGQAADAARDAGAVWGGGGRPLMMNGGEGGGGGGGRNRGEG